MTMKTDTNSKNNNFSGIQSATKKTKTEKIILQFMCLFAINKFINVVNNSMLDRLYFNLAGV